MPHTTFAYEFESQIGQFAAELSTRFSAGSVLRSFLLILDPFGNVKELVFEDGSAGWYQRPETLKSSETSHLFYDPLDDGLDYIWLSWHAIDQPVMERLIGKAFMPSDFQPIPQFERRTHEQAAPIGFPSSWGVMF